MENKEKIVRQALAAVSAELKKIDKFLDASPLSEVTQLDADILRAVEEMEIDRAGPYIQKQIKRRNALLALAKRQIKDSNKIIALKVALSIEEGDLKNELFWIEQKRA